MRDQSKNQYKKLNLSILVNRPESMTFILLILALIGASMLSEYFLDVNYILKSFTLTAELSIAALVLTMVIISGEIDLLCEKTGCTRVTLLNAM